ncbi:hypothetical protein QJS04_geneDACA016138 [Acorus gramineus]|uniref:Rab-GAP TBC domain-containing protein n=1 Tax=Acorus gramineus TaxID=55184 RepID=A0AAV9AJZ8_ACOGR|nr:hypothetical protein QJS04_geneDACA016138 [Acorus gramineus]
MSLKRTALDRLGFFFIGSEASKTSASISDSGPDGGEELEMLQVVGFGPQIVREVDMEIHGWYDTELVFKTLDKTVPPMITKEFSGLASIESNDGKWSNLEFELSQKVIDLDRLQWMANYGLPDGGGLRATTWKLLLGYLPAARDSWEADLANNRSKYFALKEEELLNPSTLTQRYETSPSNKLESVNDVIGFLRRNKISTGDHPLSLSKASVWHQFFENTEIVEQIDRDVQRTHPSMKFFSGDSSVGQKNQMAMRSILHLFAKLNPAIGYVQGMNEVLAPLFYIFSMDSDEKNALHAEADSYACFVRLLSDSVDHFCKHLDNSSVGIMATLSHFSQLIKLNDEELWRHLEIFNKVNPQFYAFRWITLLLTQEFEFHDVMRIWDSLLSNPLGIQEMLLRVCCAMVLCVKHELLSGDFAENLKLLQHYPPIDIEYILHVSEELIR